MLSLTVSHRTVKMQTFPGHRRQSTAVEEEGAAPRPHASCSSLEQIRCVERPHMDTGAPTRGPRPGPGRRAPRRGVRGPGPTHHERRGAQRRAAGGSMPEQASGAPRRDLGAAAPAALADGRAGAAGSSIARRRRAANPRLGFGASGLAHRGPGCWGGAGAGGGRRLPEPAGVPAPPARQEGRAEPSGPLRVCPRGLGGSRCGTPAPIQPGLSAARTERVTAR